MKPDGNMPERRVAMRIPARTAVRYREGPYTASNGFWKKGELMDLSMSGARFYCEGAVRPGNAIEVRIEMEINNVREELDLPAECVRVEENSIAVRFLELTDRARDALARHLARLAQNAPNRRTMRRLPRQPMILSPGRTTHVL
jgi:c-di-GMP-binding flagellar brake protein YcgR